MRESSSRHQAAIHTGLKDAPLSSEALLVLSIYRSLLFLIESTDAFTPRMYVAFSSATSRSARSLAPTRSDSRSRMRSTSERIFLTLCIYTCLCMRMCVCLCLYVCIGHRVRFVDVKHYQSAGLSDTRAHVCIQGMKWAL
jgi:hypothetical protein